MGYLCAGIQEIAYSWNKLSEVQETVELCQYTLPRIIYPASQQAN